MTVSYAILALPEGSARHGYDLKQSYDRRLAATKPIRFGQVYRILAQLVRDGPARSSASRRAPGRTAGATRSLSKG